jgi:hypothetical protein
VARVAVGLSVHSGWAVAVAVALERDQPSAVRRWHLDLADTAIPGSKQPYHAGENLPLRQAERIFERCRQRTAELSRQAIRDLASDLQGSGLELAHCAILIASERPPGTVSEVRKDHAWMHAAEGQFFRAALEVAAASQNIPIKVVNGAAVLSAHRTLNTSLEALKQRLTELGREHGKPWRQDEKLATLAGWLTLTH